MKLIILFLLSTTMLLFGQIIVDHACTDITQVPQQAIENAKANLHIAYGHTSHGSQITDGMRGLIGFADNGGKGLDLPENIFAFNNGGTNGALDYEEGDGYGDGWMDHDCGYYPNWVNETREYLDDPSHGDVNVIMWSWCGQASGRSEQQMIDTYLAPMTQLEADYPNVTFVYMTGHADGTGLDGNLHRSNTQIREYCEQNGKVLFDFYDIECYDPDGNYYGDQHVDDGCNYDGGNWAIEWQNSHTQGVDWYQCGSAHSQPLNANQKAFAIWWLWARLGGWSGPVEDATPPTVPLYLQASAISEIRVDLTWNQASDAESGVSFYRIYRDEQVLGTSASNAYSDQTCVPGESYSYTVSAVNGAGLESTQSDPAEVTTPSDSQAPSTPSGLTATAVSSSEINLSWNASTDNSGVTGYHIYRDGVEVDQTTETAWADVGLAAATAFAYQVAAFDAAGNTSERSETAEATTLDPSQEKHTLKLQTRDEVDDSFIYKGQPNANYGGEAYRGEIDRFLVKFNLPQEVMGKQIVSAHLAFYVWNQQNFYQNEFLNVYCVNTPWEENTVCWTHATSEHPWGSPGGDCDFDTPIAQIQHEAGADHVFYQPADITALVQQWVDGTRENCGLLAMNSGQTQIGIKASEYNHNQRTYLEITYTDKVPTQVQTDAIIQDYQLKQNYPNPFNPQTTIHFRLPASDFVKITVYDLQGRKIEMIVSENMNAGSHHVLFNAEYLPSGLYVYTLECGDFYAARKMLLVK